MYLMSFMIISETRLNSISLSKPSCLILCGVFTTLLSVFVADIKMRVCFFHSFISSFINFSFLLDTLFWFRVFSTTFNLTRRTLWSYSWSPCRLVYWILLSFPLTFLFYIYCIYRWSRFWKTLLFTDFDLILFFNHSF